MALEKAYKLLAKQEKISNSQAKSLIDRGLVYVGNKKVVIARGEIDTKTVFIVQKIEKIKPIFENDDIIVVDKPAYINSDEIERQFKPAKLLHRLDRETSGVLMLVKNEEFRLKAIKEFKKDNVYKEYIAWVEGVMSEPIEVDRPILTTKKNNKAYSNVSSKGKPARTEFFPDIVSAKKQKLSVLFIKEELIKLELIYAILNIQLLVMNSMVDVVQSVLCFMHIRLGYLEWSL